MRELRRRLLNGPGALGRRLLSHWAQSFDDAMEEVWEPFLELDQS